MRRAVMTRSKELYIPQSDKSTPHSSSHQLSILQLCPFAWTRIAADVVNATERLLKSHKSD